MPFIDRTKRSLPGTLLDFAACLVLAAPVLASEEPPKLGLTTIGDGGQFFDLRLEPGQTRQLRVEVADHGSSELLARTYAADGYSIINGGFAADLFGEQASGTTLWLDYEMEVLTLGSGQGLVIDFSLSVPEATPPGEYITALVAENVEPYSGGDQGGVVIEQVIRTVVAVAIDVPGPRRPALEIGEVGHKEAAGMSFVSVEVGNEGNEHLKPNGEFFLQDVSGTKLASSEVAMDSVYAGTETLLEAPLSEALRPGEYCAELSLADEATGVTDDRVLALHRGGSRGAVGRGRWRTDDPRPPARARRAEQRPLAGTGRRAGSCAGAGDPEPRPASSPSVVASAEASLVLAARAASEAG